MVVHPAHMGNYMICYISPEVPLPPAPGYSGKDYEALVPATLDVAERARLAVNAVTEPLDPDYDFELYWVVDLLAKQPAMYHTVDDHVQAKFVQALPLVRTASGSRQNLNVEHRLLHVLLKMQGPDGLVYIPIKGRPWALPAAPSPWAGLDYLPTGDHWCSIAQAGRILGAFCIYALKDPAGPWRDAANRLAAGLMNLCIVEGDVAYLFCNCTEPGRPVVKPAARPVGLRAAIAGWVAQGLAQCCRSIGNRPAGVIAEKLMRYVMRDSGYFGPEGEFREEFPGSGIIHFHAHTCQIMAALEVVQATGNKELLGLALKGYQYAVKQGEPLVGFFPEWLNYKGPDFTDGQCSSEICEVADMIAAAIKLSLLGIDKWDDADRWIRNQFSEGQLTGTAWLSDGHLKPADRTACPVGDGGDWMRYHTTDRVPERVTGSFASWASASDFADSPGWAIGHCCTGNGTRTIYYAWEKTIACDGQTLRVNLLLNRASRWADIDSHIPYAGIVDVHAKQPLAVEIRLPEWVKQEDANATVDGAARALTFDGRYARVGRVDAGQCVRLQFPVVERTDSVIIEKRKYTIIRRGNEVVHIDPPGRNCPLYQRGHYRCGETLWKKTTRFVPEREIEWA